VVLRRVPLAHGGRPVVRDEAAELERGRQLLPPAQHQLRLHAAAAAAVTELGDQLEVKHGAARAAEQLEHLGGAGAAQAGAAAALQRGRVQGGAPVQLGGDGAAQTRDGAADVGVERREPTRPAAARRCIGRRPGAVRRGAAVAAAGKRVGAVGDAAAGGCVAVVLLVAVAAVAAAAAAGFFIVIKSLLHCFGVWVWVGFED